MFDLCRLCGLEKCFIDLVDIKEAELNVFRTVDLHCRVILKKDKLLPQNVCKNCINVLNSFITYSENLKAVQSRLEKDLAGAVKINDSLVDSEPGVELKPEIKVEILQIDSGSTGFENQIATRNKRKRNTVSSKAKPKPKSTQKSPAIAQSTEFVLEEFLENDLNLETDKLEEVEEEDIFEASDDDEFLVDEEGSDSDASFGKKTKPSSKRKMVPAKSTKPATSKSATSSAVTNDKNSLPTVNLFEIIFKEELAGNHAEKATDLDIPVTHKNSDGTISEDGWHLISPIKWNDVISTNCKTCDLEFENLFLLKEHYRTKHSARCSEVDYGCKHCTVKKKFSSVHPLVNHVIEQHYVHLKYSCYMCNSMFWNFTSLYYHYKFQHPEAVCSLVFCLTCGIHYYDKKQMQRHRDTHREGNKSYDTIFAKELSTDLSLMENKLGVLEEEKNLDGSISESARERLELLRWDSIRIDCSLCEQKDFTILDLRDHYEKDHDKSKPRDKIYTCKTGICTFSKSNEKIGGVVVHHILSHDKRLSFSCICCSKYFWNHVSLHFHYRHCHYQLKPFLCLFCGFFSRDMSQLNRHLLTHDVEGIKKHICEHCGKAFATNSNLKMHVDQVHSAVMNYECKICHHKFKSKYRYKYHIATHTDARPHQCSICKARFKAKVTLNDHYRTHFAERRYGCSHCDKRFHKGHDLKVHERLHTGDFPYVCSVCNIRYPAWSNLFKHAKSRHGLDIASQRAKTYRDIKENDEEIPEVLRNELN